MGSARTVPRHGDRATNLSTGEVGKIIDVHTKAEPWPAYSVLPDGGHRCVMWFGADVEWKA